LGDFGFAKKSEELDRTFAGTNRYMSPEVLCGEDYSFEVDMWSFGVLLYFMLHKKHPFVISTQMIPD
jgi:serine/threonine protein kinase